MATSVPLSAVLGPTNTGKTHRAVERMLSYDTGMLGFPLRLLAREVYDRVSVRVGEDRVALVTGEEKRIPRRPSYWICTVEAMPMHREVDFLGVDEIQLAAHDQRGHVYTDRILHARGRKETWFLGSHTMRPLLSELLPTAQLVEHPRLSRLRHTGPSSLSHLPRRSAVVAFGMAQVYELAERLRALRGGTAVVLGALSPRTRNAQVALFQSGEVDYLVATDAIGMGLNLDVTHVAFAGLRKFDGRDIRSLDDAECGQIAGRAGRYLSDGTFGALSPLHLPDDLAFAIEHHHYAPVKRIYFRNSDLDFTSLEGLVASLKTPPRHGHFRAVPKAEDFECLLRLAQIPAIAARARTPERIALLWDICRIPDFRKLLLEAHVHLLADIYLQLCQAKGRLDHDYVNGHLQPLEDTTGDVDTLIARIAAVRTWTYVANHEAWVEGADELQEYTRSLEDRLSDALHERLVQRFVEQGTARKSPLSRKRAQPSPPPAPEEVSVAPSHPFAALAALRARVAPGAQTPAPEHQHEATAWVEGFLQAPTRDISLDRRGFVTWQGRTIGKLVPGRTLLQPEARLAEVDSLGAGARSRLQRRIVAFARDVVHELLEPLRAAFPSNLSPDGRGLLHFLEQDFGTVLMKDALEQWQRMPERERAHLRANGLQVGSVVLYAPALLQRQALLRRITLTNIFHGRTLEGTLVTPFHERIPVSFVPKSHIPPRTLTSWGFVVFAHRAIRADMVDRIHLALKEGSTSERTLSATIGSWLGCPPRNIPALGQKILEASCDPFSAPSSLQNAEYLLTNQSHGR